MLQLWVGFQPKNFNISNTSVVTRISVRESDLK